MHRALPDLRIRVFPNSSHMPFYEQPEPYFAVLVAFLRSVRRWLADLPLSNFLTDAIVP